MADSFGIFCGPVVFMMLCIDAGAGDRPGSAGFKRLFMSRGLPSSAERFFDATEPRGIGVSAALTGSTLPLSSWMHLLYIGYQYMLQMTVGGKIRDAYLTFTALEAGLASAALSSVGEHGHAIHCHWYIGIDVRTGAR